jgi:MFS family permease
VSNRSGAQSPEFYQRNLPLFIAFRVLFHARFYYPVIGVLFLDLGLTLEQYAVLNVIWAATIVLCEIPSGALADAWGRKAMVVISAALMVVEMVIFAFAPTGNPYLLFWLLVGNRVLSGLAEASSSGADEALAYDSLPPEHREEHWAQTLASLMRWKSGAFIVAMLAGGALFDSNFLRGVTEFFGIDLEIPNTTRFPVFATLCTAVLALVVALLMREPPADGEAKPATEHSVRSVLANILRGARHVCTVRRVTLLLVAALLLDSFVRLFLTFASNYYRLIQLPEVWNGVLGAGVALLGFLVAPLARQMVGAQGPARNFSILFVLVGVGLCGLAAAVPYYGVWVLLPLGVGMSGLQFFTSYYLNQWTDSSMRATVLSFRGVAFNLAYGAVGIAFAGLTKHLRSASGNASENEIFGMALTWLPASFLACAVIVVGSAAFLTQKKKPHSK